MKIKCEFCDFWVDTRFGDMKAAAKMAYHLTTKHPQEK